MIIDSSFVVFLRRKRQYIKAGDINCQIKCPMKKEQYLDNTELLEQNQKMRERFIELQQEYLVKQSKWLKFLAKTISVILGILVSFGRPDKEMPFTTNIWLVAGIVLLTFSLIFLLICIYDDKELDRRGYLEIAKEAPLAYEEKRKAKTVKLQIRTKVLEKTGYILFASALISFCVFMILCLL